MGPSSSNGKCVIGRWGMLFSVRKGATQYNKEPHGGAGATTWSYPFLLGGLSRFSCRRRRFVSTKVAICVQFGVLHTLIYSGTSILGIWHAIPSLLMTAMRGGAMWRWIGSLPHSRNNKNAFVKCNKYLGEKCTAYYRPAHGKACITIFHYLVALDILGLDTHSSRFVVTSLPQLPTPLGIIKKHNAKYPSCELSLPGTVSVLGFGCALVCRACEDEHKRGLTLEYQNSN